MRSKTGVNQQLPLKQLRNIVKTITSFRFSQNYYSVITLEPIPKSGHLP